MPYRVTYAIDSLDPNPEVLEFETEGDAIEWLWDAMTARVDYLVQHSPYTVTDEDYGTLWQQECALARIDAI